MDTVPQKYIFKNGLRCILLPNPNNIFIGAVYVGVGSLNENEKITGIAHLIEHLMFLKNISSKATLLYSEAKKATKKKKKRQLTTIFNEKGIEYNGHTTHNYTKYYLTFEHIGLSRQDLISKIKFCISNLIRLVSKLQFTKSELSKVKKVILRESVLRETAETELAKIIEEKLFPNSTYKYGVIGDKKILEKISESDIRKFADKFYNPSNMLMVLYGTFDFNKMMKFAEKELTTNFKHWKDTFQEFNPFATFTYISQIKPFLYLKQLNSKNTSIYFYFRVNETYSNDFLEICNNLLSDNLSLILREKYAQIYTINTDIVRSQTTVFLQINYNVSDINGYKSITSVLKTLRSFKKNIMPIDIDTAFQNYKNKLVNYYENKHNLMDYYGVDGVFSQLNNFISSKSSLLEYIEGLRKSKYIFDISFVKQALGDIINSSNLNLFVFGKIKEIQSNLKTKIKTNIFKLNTSN